MQFSIISGHTVETELRHYIPKDFKDTSLTIPLQGRPGLFISTLFLKMFIHSEDLTVLFTKAGLI